MRPDQTPPPSPPEAEVPASLKSELAYQKLRGMILSFELRTGQAVSERMLEGHTGVSRTSVRWALSKLEAEGLIRREGRSYIVTPIDPEEIAAAHDFLAAMEPAALLLIKPEQAGAELDALAALIDRVERSDSVDDFIETTLLFHAGLVRLANNAFFSRAMEDAHTRLSRAAWLTRWLDRRTRADWSRARRILALVRAGQPAEAGEALREIFRQSRAQMVRLVREERQGLLAKGVAIS